ncbi:hypothetical protein EON79_11835 [bacterium]|nr:MAG: hypothetical protein EON79_11835 [bacterium]
MTLSLSSPPRLPRRLTGTVGKLTVIGAFVALALADSFFARWVIASYPDAESFMREVIHYSGQTVYWIGVVAGPLWAVLDDRTYEHPVRAMIRGTAISLFALSLPFFLLLFESQGGTTYDLFAHWVWLVPALISALVFVMLSEKPDLSGRGRTLPLWLAGPGGRFALLSLLACVAMGFFQISARFNGASDSPPPAMIYLATVAAIPLGILRIGASSIWTVLDDRRTEQPWFAVARGVCLAAFLNHIGGMVSGLYFKKNLPDLNTADSFARDFGFSASDIAITVMSAAVFVLLPVPKPTEVLAA